MKEYFFIFISKNRNIGYFWIVIKRIYLAIDSSLWSILFITLSYNYKTVIYCWIYHWNRLLTYCKSINLKFMSNFFSFMIKYSPKNSWLIFIFFVTFPNNNKTIIRKSSNFRIFFKVMFRIISSKLRSYFTCIEVKQLSIDISFIRSQIQSYSHYNKIIIFKCSYWRKSLFMVLFTHKKFRTYFIPIIIKFLTVDFISLWIIMFSFPNDDKMIVMECSYGKMCLIELTTISTNHKFCTYLTSIIIKYLVINSIFTFIFIHYFPSHDKTTICKCG